MKVRVNNKYKEFVKLLDFSNGKYNITDIFRDFVVMFAIAIQNQHNFIKEDEEIYLETIKKYSKEERNIFPKLIVELLIIYSGEEDKNDVLGEIYEQICANSKHLSQFFTPNHIAEAIASISVDKTDIDTKEFIEVLDPACGSGVLLIQYANKLNKEGINYKDKVYFVAQDIDYICVCMTYIQMAIYELPGKVIWGNSLLGENKKTFYTPQFFIGKWYDKKIS